MRAEVCLSRRDACGCAAGTSKGGYFLAADLPADEAQRNAFLLRAMGSPDIRQIDGMGGGDPLTSKVAVVRKSSRDGVDVDYLFLQVLLTNRLSRIPRTAATYWPAVGPFAIERGLVKTADPVTPVTIFMENSGQIAVARVATPGPKPTYRVMPGSMGFPELLPPYRLNSRTVPGRPVARYFLAAGLLM